MSTNTELTGCACRWDADDKRVATCVRHQGWLDVVQEWADRVRAAEAQLAAAQGQEPVGTIHEDGYWVRANNPTGNAISDAMSIGKMNRLTVYAAPIPQQPAAGPMELSDEEILDANWVGNRAHVTAHPSPTGDGLIAFARAILAAAQPKVKVIAESLYDRTGDIKAFNTVLIGRDALQELEEACAAQPVQVNAMLVEALQFYADKDHFMLHNEDAWETVSGEPQNFFEDESNTATVEDGSVARAALTAAKQAQPARPINCGTGHCSCIECPYEQAQPERAPLTCTWTQEDDFDMPGVYHTACGEMWSFTEGGIKENNAKFCPYCGGGIKQGGQHD